jgi:hypothetical protein
MNDYARITMAMCDREGRGMASIVEEYEREFRPFYDVAEAGKTAVWEFSQMFGEEDSDSESGDDSDDGTACTR